MSCAAVFVDTLLVSANNHTTPFCFCTNECSAIFKIVGRGHFASTDDAGTPSPGSTVRGRRHAVDRVGCPPGTVEAPPSPKSGILAVAPLASGLTVRHLTLDQGIEGSNPSSPAIHHARFGPPEATPRAFRFWPDLDDGAR